MLRLLSSKCTLVLSKNNIIHDNEKNVYIYGFELFWSTLFCVSCIICLGAIFGYLNAACVFLMFFMPIRMAAGGYHAKTYGSCFALTNAITLICIMTSKIIVIMNYRWIYVCTWLSLLISVVYVWKAAPVNIGTHSLNPQRVSKNKKYARFILFIEFTLLVAFWYISADKELYTAIIATDIVAYMIYLAKREGR